MEMGKRDWRWKRQRDAFNAGYWLGQIDWTDKFIVDILLSIRYTPGTWFLKAGWARFDSSERPVQTRFPNV